MDATDKLFRRDGTEYTGAVARDDKGKPFFTYRRPCSRCGGAGGSDRWAHTGWTCYECGGARFTGPVTEKLYTVDQLAKLNATRDKRNAKKAAQAAVRAAAQEAERNANRAAFIENNKPLFEIAAGLGDEFVDNMIAECVARVRLSENQVVLIVRKLVQAAVKAQGAYADAVGVRREFSCKLEKFFDWSNTDGFPKFYKYCHIMRDDSGNVVKYVGSKLLGGVSWKRHGYGDTEIVVDRDAVLTFKATVTEHVDYKGEKQTIVSRPALIDSTPESEAL